MALLTVQNATLNGLNKTYTSAGATGDKFVNDGNTYLFVKNGSASSITVTVTSLKACDQGVIHNLTVTVPASGEMQIGKFNPDRFNDTTNQVAVSYSATTSVTVAVVRGN